MYALPVVYKVCPTGSAFETLHVLRHSRRPSVLSALSRNCTVSQQQPLRWTSLRSSFVNTLVGCRPCTVPPDQTLAYPSSPFAPPPPLSPVPLIFWHPYTLYPVVAQALSMSVPLSTFLSFFCSITASTSPYSYSSTSTGDHTLTHSQSYACTHARSALTDKARTCSHAHSTFLPTTTLLTYDSF